MRYTVVVHSPDACTVNVVSTEPIRPANLGVVLYLIAPQSSLVPLNPNGTMENVVCFSKMLIFVEMYDRKSVCIKDVFWA